MWAYPQHATKKIKLAMSVGRHYRIAEIQPQHFGNAALACGLNPTWAHVELEQLAEMLPDTSSQVAREIFVKGMNKGVIARLVDGVARQCAGVRRAFETAARVAKM